MSTIRMTEEQILSVILAFITSAGWPELGMVKVEEGKLCSFQEGGKKARFRLAVRHQENGFMGMFSDIQHPGPEDTKFKLEETPEQLAVEFMGYVSGILDEEERMFKQVHHCLNEECRSRFFGSTCPACGRIYG